jgi:pimeloyl-ACP methyl ester carboxylesterase
VTFAGIAPFDTEPDWMAGMQAPGGLLAALDGLDERERFAETDEFDPESFIPADYDLLDGDWRSLGADAGAAGARWPMGLVDDDMSATRPWGFDLGDIRAPVLVVQGGLDRVVPPAHADRILRAVRSAELWLRPLDGHVSVLAGVPVAMDWMLAGL